MKSFILQFPREPCHSLHREPFSPSAFLLGEKVPKADEGAFHKGVIRAPSSALGPASVNRPYLVKRPPHPPSAPSPPAKNRGGRRALDEGSGKCGDSNPHFSHAEWNCRHLLVAKLGATCSCACLSFSAVPPIESPSPPAVFSWGRRACPERAKRVEGCRRRMRGRFTRTSFAHLRARSDQRR